MNWKHIGVTALIAVAAVAILNRMAFGRSVLGTSA